MLTVYNRPSVACTIDSILNQTYQNFEFIIVDNASEDNTCDVIRAYKDNRIHLIINKSNMGQTYSLNRGLQLAKGKYIARIDADDIAVRDRLEKQVNFMETHSKYVLCGSWVRYINDKDQLTITVPMPTTDRGFRIMQLVTCGMYHPAAMMRRNILEKYQIVYDSKIQMAEDYEMWRRLMYYGKVCNLGEVLVYYRRGSNNDGKTHKDIMRKESYIVRKRVCMNWKDKEEAKKMLKLIALEEQDHKNIFEAVLIARFYRKYLRQHLRKTEADYALLRKQFLLKTYGVTVANNTALWSQFLQLIYKFLLNTRYKIGIRKRQI